MLFRSHSAVDKPLLASSRGSKTSLDLGIDLVIQTWHRWEHRRLQHLAIFSQLEWISLVVSLLASSNHDGNEHELIKDVRRGQIINDGVVLGQAANQTIQVG